MLEKIIYVGEIMNRCIIYAITLILYVHATSCAHEKPNEKIKILCTSALTSKHYELRKQEYIRALSLLKGYGLDPYLVEAIASGPTFLDEHCNHVLYTRSNNFSLRNYGINEAVSMRIGLEHFNFDPETIIIKITGRYPLESDDFLQLVEENLDADVIAKTWHENDVCTGLFAIRQKYLLDFLRNLDLKQMERQWTPIEHLFGAYITKIEKDGAKVIHMEKMYDYIKPDGLSTSATWGR
jgi:hypothetical protein